MLRKSFSLQERSLFPIHDPISVKILTRLWIKCSNLKEHKFCHNFKDTVVPMCNCGTETETTEHFFLRCPVFLTERQKHLVNIYRKYFSSQNLNEESMIDILLYGCDKFNERHEKKFFFIPLIILNPLNVLKGH